jgi:hypothetical protein
MTMHTQDKLDVIGRVGFAARAIVYGLIGIFAIRLSFGMGGSYTDSRGILVRLLKQPFGELLLVGLGIGLLCFAVWRGFQALADSEHHGKDLKGTTMRVGYFISGAVHVLLAFSAINLVFHLTRASGPGAEKELAKTLAEWGPGEIAVAIAGLIIAGVGIGQLVVAFKETFAKALAIPRDKAWLRTVSKIGIAARGFVFMVIGWLFVRAAMHSNAAEADGLHGVWGFLRELPYGRGLILALAAGLIAFSIYGFTEAAYRKRAAY